MITISTLVYSNDFEDGKADGWSTAPAAADPFTPTNLTPVDDGTGNTAIESTGPWWLDQNHMPPGAGYLYLTLFGYAISGDENLKPSLSTPLDLLGATFNFSIQATANFAMPADASIYFWFQSWDPAISRYVNYLYSADDFSSNLQVGNWTQESITLSSNDADWIALNSNSYRTDTYGKSYTIKDALALPVSDFGVFIYTPTDPSASPASGSLLYDNITITQGLIRAWRETGSTSEAHLIQPDVAISNSAPNFGNAELKIAFADGGRASDILSIANQGSDAGQISFDGTNVSYQGVLIGIMSGGNDGAPLVVDFNTSADANAVEALLNAVTYTNSSSGSVEREIDIVMSDASGSTSIAMTLDVIKTVLGTSGDDHLVGSGSDDLIGQMGDDWYFVNDTADRVIEAAGGGNDRVLANVDYTLPAGQEIEMLTTQWNTGTDPLKLTGNELANVIYGNAGDNVLNGGGGTAADTIVGLGGNDWYFVNHPGDMVIEAAGGGTDRVLAGMDYTLPAGQEIEMLTTQWNAGTEPLKLTGNELANVIYGNAGDNILDGGGGTAADTMVGLGGDDWYFVNHPGDTVFEAAGGGTADRVWASVDYTLPVGQEIEILSTQDSSAFTSLKLIGNEFANTIYGNEGNNILNGGGGAAADTMAGYGGDDWYFVNHSSDTVIEAAGGGNDRVLANVDYTLPAGQEIEMLTTQWNTGTDPLKLTGNELANVIYGNAGDNVLNGGGGNDTLIGNGGHDTFLFNTPIGAPNGVVTIIDFGPADDAIALDHSIFGNIGSTGTLAVDAFNSGAGMTAATTASGRIVYDTTSGALYYDADGVGGAAPIEFAQLTNHPNTLTHSDFLIA